MLLTRTDYAQVSGTNRGVLSLVNLQSRQGLIVGDQSGTLSLYALNSSASIIWSNTLRGISHIEVSQDTIYVSSGCNVHSFTTSGKEISSFDTNVAESIKTFKVKGSEIWTTGKYLYNHYVNQKEADYLILRDTINDLSICNITGDLINNAVLACNDKSIRIIDGVNTIYTCVLSSSPSSIKSFSSHNLLFGSVSGTIGMLNLERESGHLLWSLQNKSNEITALSSFDFEENGNQNIIVCRSDGDLEIFSYKKETGEFLSICEMNINEAITSLVCGKPQGKPELILSTYSGKIIGLADNSKTPDFNMTRTLTNEISTLKQQIEETKKQYTASLPKTQSSTPKIMHKLALVGEQAAYCLSLESQFPIQMILLQADIPIELLENDEHEATITSSEENGQALITFRFSDKSHTRAQVLFRNSEGQPGTLNTYILPYLDPKIAQLVTIEIKPLSLHEKVISISASDRPLNSLKITGGFSKNEMHGWISQTLPDVPPSPPDDIITLYYTSCVIGTVLIVTYSSAWAEFRSESVSVLAILKENILKHASFRKIHMEAGFIEAYDSCEYVIKLIEAHIVELQELETKYQLIEALKEIEIQGDLTKFGEEIVTILQQAEEIKTQYKKYPKKLQFFQGMVSDLYVDYCKFRGVLNFVERIPHLQSLLANFDAEALTAFFKQ